VTTDMHRRSFIAQALAALVLLVGAGRASGQPVSDAAFRPNKRWSEAAFGMKRLAESWGDQPYGAVLVLGDELVGEGPSRVVKRGDPTAHAEREAIRDAQRRLQRTDLAGSVLYSTSRPCAACEAAAAAAGIGRMIFGEELNDAGVPRSTSAGPTSEYPFASASICRPDAIARQTTQSAARPA
jgi:tRNA(Arg) A34 adenosine deaminase TadA